MLDYLLISLIIVIISKTIFNIFRSWKTVLHAPYGYIKNKAFAFFNIELLLILVFIKTITAHLVIVALPSYIVTSVVNQGYDASWGSILYTCYQISFFLMLIPGSYFAENYKIKYLLIITLVLEVIAFALYGFSNNVWLLLSLQIAFGILIPISSAAEYAFLFKLSSKKNRGEVIAMYNNNIRGAIMVGIFCGGFMVAAFGIRNVFFTSAIIDLIAGICIIPFLPNIKPKCNINLNKNNNIKNMLKPSLKLFALLFCVALPLGLLEEGVVLFGLPLFLTKHNIIMPKIGKLLTICTIGFFLTNKYFSRLADKFKMEKYFILIGLIGFAGSQILFNNIFQYINQQQQLLWLSISLFVLGVSKGCFVSPALSFVTKTKLASEYSKNIIIANYRVVKTLGKILGPVLMMQIFIYSQYAPSSFLISGFSFLMFIILLFWLTSAKKKWTFPRN